MAVAYLKSVVIVDDGMYHGNGIVIRWVGRVTRRFARDARTFAPRRTGMLKAGIHAGTPRNPLRKVVQGTISSSAPHTMYVLRGTHGPIMSNALWAVGGPDSPAAWQIVVTRSKKGAVHVKRIPAKGMTMAVGRRGGHPPVSPRMTVSGQKANNFMLKAWITTGQAHPAIRGVSFPIPLRAR